LNDRRLPAARLWLLLLLLLLCRCDECNEDPAFRLEIDPEDSVPELRRGMEPVKDGFRGIVDDVEEVEGGPKACPEDGCGCFDLRGMTIGSWWEELNPLLLLLPPDFRRGMEPSNEVFFFGILHEFDPLPELF